MSRWLDNKVLEEILEDMSDKDGQYNDEDLGILNEHGMGICCVSELMILFLPLAPLLKSSLPYWSTGLIAQFLGLSLAVGLLGRVISSSQGLYLNTGQHKHRKTQTHFKHPCSGWDSNLQSWPLSSRRLSIA
jgi:hypothetical protein